MVADLLGSTSADLTKNRAAEDVTEDVTRRALRNVLSQRPLLEKKPGRAVDLGAESASTPSFDSRAECGRRVPLNRRRRKQRLRKIRKRYGTALDEQQTSRRHSAYNDEFFRISFASRGTFYAAREHNVLWRDDFLWGKAAVVNFGAQLPHL
uniref:Uncharacterized protein n=1 Tax=Steinernema glaseri TaxID=37863 RepID=A0A1I8A192_9BILA